jgi:hypothetical protein
LTTEDLDRLRTYLSGLPSGPVADPKTIVGLLERCWHLFAGSDLKAMGDHKLRRMEGPLWYPPCLSFEIERHRGTCMGSSRAEVQSWKVNLDTGTAECDKAGHRQLRKTHPKLEVEPIADDLIGLIVAGRSDARLKWLEAGRRVRILIGKVVPETDDRGRPLAKDTVAGRRRRMARALEARLRVVGWTKAPGTAPHIYEIVGRADILSADEAPPGTHPSAVLNSRVRRMQTPYRDCPPHFRPRLRIADLVWVGALDRLAGMPPDAATAAAAAEQPLPRSITSARRKWVRTRMSWWSCPGFEQSVSRLTTKPLAPARPA